MKRAALFAVSGVIAGLVAIPTVAFAQDAPEYCELATPAVRDVVQDAPAIAAVLNLDPALPNATIEAKRAEIGCGPSPDQTPDEARAAVCGILTEAKIDELVAETNNPDAVVLLDTVRPAIPEILGQARTQLRCDVPVGSTPEIPSDNEKDAPTTAPQVREAPRNGVATGVK